jgi:hypothetical protein
MVRTSVFTKYVFIRCKNTLAYYNAKAVLCVVANQSQDRLLGQILRSRATYSASVVKIYIATR